MEKQNDKIDLSLTNIKQDENSFQITERDKNSD